MWSRIWEVEIYFLIQYFFENNCNKYVLLVKLNFEKSVRRTENCKLN